MKTIGRALAIICLPLLLGALGATESLAEVSASLDRDRVTVGDTLRLTITATENEDLNNIDLRPLLSDFEILQRSTSSNTTIANGRRSHTRQLLVDLTARREGTLKIPPMRVGHGATNMLLVAVSPAPDSDTGGQTLLFDAVVDRQQVYVQGQIILTLRLQQAINLESRSITELELDNAFVKPLEQKSFQRQMDGRPWLVHEVRYAIFPEQSGILEIPAQTFSARESKPRRGFFDLNSGGRLIRRNTQALQIEVLPRPDAFPSGTWLPARALTIEESWSTPPEQLRAGESATRTVRIQGEGLQGAQLPPVTFYPGEGLKYYPDQPAISDTEISTGLQGVRQDSAALVPTRSGQWTIPEIRIPWWDTEASELRYAVLPAREISVAAANPTTSSTPTLVTPPLHGEGDIPLAAVAAGENNEGEWRVMAIVSCVGWLLTLAYLLWSRRRPAPEIVAADNPTESHAFKQLLSACDKGDSSQARHAFIAWSATLEGSPVVSLSQAAALFNDPALDTELEVLNSRLYSRDTGEWNGAALADTARRLRKRRRAAMPAGDAALELYPVAQA